MLSRTIALVFLSFAFVIAGCSSPQPDDLIKKSLRQWVEACEIIEGISDEGGVRLASKDLDALAQRMVELNRQASAQEMSPEARRMLEADNRKETQTVLKRFNDAALKVRAIPGGEAMLVRFRRSAGRTF